MHINLLDSVSHADFPLVTYTSSRIIAHALVHGFISQFSLYKLNLSSRSFVFE